jgi:hypothetical protein
MGKKIRPFTERACEVHLRKARQIKWSSVFGPYSEKRTERITKTKQIRQKKNNRTRSKSSLKNVELYHQKTVLNWVNKNCTHIPNSYVAYNASSETFFAKGPAEIKPLSSSPTMLCQKTGCFESSSLVIYTKTITRNKCSNCAEGYIIKIERGKEEYKDNILPISCNLLDWDPTVQPKCERCGIQVEEGDFVEHWDDTSATPTQFNWDHHFLASDEDTEEIWDDSPAEIGIVKPVEEIVLQQIRHPSNNSDERPSNSQMKMPTSENPTQLDHPVLASGEESDELLEDSPAKIALVKPVKEIVLQQIRHPSNNSDERSSNSHKKMPRKSV